MTTPPVRPPPGARLLEMATGFFLSRLVYLAAKLGIADHLADGPKSADELALTTGSDATSLHRFLRTLTNFDILSLGPDGAFALTSLGEALRNDAPGYTRSAILIMGSNAVWDAWRELPYVVDTGKPGFDKANGKAMFDFLGDNPDDARWCSETMLAVHSAEPAAVAEAYDFSSAGVIVDVGGASGSMLASVLTRHASPRGVLFDLPQATTEASALLRKRGVDSRVRLEHGSFFEGVPAGGDIYILSHIIHDWPEEQALAILRDCREAMTPSSRLLLVELVLRDGGSPGHGSADMTMLVLFGAAERTAREYDALLAKAGLRITRVIPTPASASIIEACVQ
ncbi:MAG: methyltransferase [Gemmatimonadaceae bacterium]